MNKKLIAIPTLLSFLILGMVAYRISQVPAVPVHYHANFAVFVDGKQIDFTKPQLMHIAPCATDTHVSLDPMENVHLHDGIGNVVHLHMRGITWKTFFDAIQFDYLPLTQDRSLTVYRNGKSVSPGILFENEIGREDRILVHIATESGAQLVSQVPLLQKEDEKVGNNAKDYDEGKIGIEKCGADGKRSLWQRAKIAFDL